MQVCAKLPMMHHDDSSSQAPCVCVAGNGIKSARGLTSLQSLKCLKACGLHWGLEDCQHLAILTDLRSLELPTNPVTDEGAGNLTPTQDDIYHLCGSAPYSAGFSLHYSTAFQARGQGAASGLQSSML